MTHYYYVLGFTGGSGSKESTSSMGDLGLIFGLERFLGEGHGNPLQYSCLENLHGQRSLAGYSRWGRKESDTTKWLAQQWFSIKSESALPHSLWQCMEMCSTVPIWGPAIPFFSQYNLAHESQSPTHILPTPEPSASSVFPSLPNGVCECAMKETCPVL